MNNDNIGGCLAAVLAFAFLGGNIFLFTGALDGDMADNGFAWLMVIIAVIGDIALILWLLSVVGKAKASSYEKRREKTLTERKEVIAKEIGDKISHKNEIQQIFDKHFEKIERQFSLVSLISSCMGNNNQELKSLLVSNKEEAFAIAQKEIFNRLSESEKKRFPKNVAEVAVYRKTLEQEISELKIALSSVATSNDEQLFAMMQKHCPELHKSIKYKRRKLIATIVIPTAIIITLLLILMFSLSYIKNKPYQELHHMIEEQSLTTEMCDWSNRENKGSYYEYFHTEKGYKFLASELTKLHRDNDIKKAMWLLCIQPDCIDGITVCASDSFIDWVVNYSRENGSQKADSNNNTIYSVDGYDITISSIFEYSIGHYFRISNGQNKASVERKNPYYKENVPTIQ